MQKWLVVCGGKEWSIGHAVCHFPIDFKRAVCPSIYLLELPIQFWSPLAERGNFFPTPSP